MAMEHRTVMEIRLNTPPEARRTLEGVRLELQDRLLERYGSRLGIEVGEVSDPGKELAEAVVGSVCEEKVLSLSFHLYRGAREGASLVLRWEFEKPTRLAVVTTPTSKLEARLLEWFIGTPLVVLAISTFLFISSGLIPVVLAALLGGAIGTGIYYALAAPLLALTAGRSGGTNAVLARDLHALAVRCIREIPSVPCAAPAIPTAHAPSKAIAPVRS